MTRADSPEKVLDSAVAGVWPVGVLGVGMDLVDVEALRRLVEEGGEEFVLTCWTAQELEDTRSQPSRLAARWAAKEAVMKALGKGIGEISPTDIEIVSETSGAPRVRLHGAAAEVASAFGARALQVSMTHESSWAAAIAVAGGGGQHHEEAEVAR